MKFSTGKMITFLLLIFVVAFLGVYAGFKMFNPEAKMTSNISEANQTEVAEESVQSKLNDIRKVYSLIVENYVDEVDPTELLEGSIQGMIDTLDDPYSSYMDHEAMEKFDEQISSSFQGIGAEVSMKDGKVTIVSPIKDSPAEKAGLRPNDQILQVDDVKLEKMDLHEAVSHIRGEKGTEVTLLIDRKSASEPFEVTLKRDEIPLETVSSELKEKDGKKTGIITLTSFSETTADEFNKALEKLENQKIDGLVLDVRGNPGGLLDAVEDIMENFIPDDVPYVQIEERDGEVEKYYSSLEEKKPYPINIIIDEGSASASEILAIALKDVGYDVVGDTSFGKGTVQRTFPLGDEESGGLVKLTYFKWLSPEGTWIHEKGIEPTVKQKLPELYYTNYIQIEDDLKFDEVNDQIKSAQQMLKGLGFDPGREDGYFGEKTKAAVESFQSTHNLAQSGIIDEKTAGKIEEEVMELVRSGEQDTQLHKALEVLYK